jgi:putative FmdB family regulatory protein
MPIYEYLCSVCGARFERLVRELAPTVDPPVCPDCGSASTERVMSAFARHGAPGIDREAAQAEQRKAERLASITPKEQIDRWRSGRDSKP